MVTLSMADILVLLSSLGGLMTIVFYGGKLSSRVESLEEWRRSIPQELTAIHSAIRETQAMIRGSE